MSWYLTPLYKYAFPILKHVTLVRSDVRSSESAIRRWITEQWEYPMTTSILDGADIRYGIRKLLPLTAPGTRRYLFMSTENREWTAIFNNSALGSPIDYLRSCKGIYINCPYITIGMQPPNPEGLYCESYSLEFDSQLSEYRFLGSSKRVVWFSDERLADMAVGSIGELFEFERSDIILNSFNILKFIKKALGLGGFHCFEDAFYPTKSGNDAPQLLDIDKPAMIQDIRNEQMYQFNKLFIENTPG